MYFNGTIRFTIRCQFTPVVATASRIDRRHDVDYLPTSRQRRSETTGGRPRQ
jgi:hypothetical protein